MTKDKALKLAFEALHYCEALNSSVEKQKMQAITAIKAALEAKDEPVAKYSDIVSDGGLDPRNKFDTPPQRKPLTDEQAMNAYCETPPFGTYREAFVAGIRFIEAAHGIK